MADSGDSGKKGGLSMFGVAELGKAMEVFIEKVSYHLGRLYEPTYVKRIAKAEAEAAVIRAQAQASVRKIEVVTENEIQDFEQIVRERRVLEELRKQSVAGNAVPLIKESAKPDQLDADWLENFFDKVRLVSTDEMQRLWTFILAGEANAPGSFSKRTVNLVASMDKDEAAYFSSLCRFFWHFGDDPVPLVFETNGQPYFDHGTRLHSLTVLDSIGLIRLDGVQEFVFGQLPPKFLIRYFDTWIGLEVPEGKVKVGHVLLTPVGKQLGSICRESPVPGFVDYVIDRWEAAGIKVDRRPNVPPTSPHAHEKRSQP